MVRGSKNMSLWSRLFKQTDMSAVPTGRMAGEGGSRQTAQMEEALRGGVGRAEGRVTCTGLCLCSSGSSRGSLGLSLGVC